MPDTSYILAAAFLVLAGVGIYAASRFITRRGSQARGSTMGERGRTDVGSPLFPPSPQVVDEPDQPGRSGAKSTGHGKGG